MLIFGFNILKGLSSEIDLAEKMVLFNWSLFLGRRRDGEIFSRSRHSISSHVRGPLIVCATGIYMCQGIFNPVIAPFHTDISNSANILSDEQSK